VRECVLRAQGAEVGPSTLSLLWWNSSVAPWRRSGIRREGGAVLTMGLWMQDGIAGVSRGRGVLLPCRETATAPQAVVSFVPVPPPWW
jgi:hypothetical protein